MDKSSVVYTLKDCGCYVDNARGIYAVDAIVKFARAHGASIPDPTDDEWDGKSLSTYEWPGEVEDDADEFMNSKFPVKGAYWGRNECGDWGLWKIETK